MAKRLPWYLGPVSLLALGIVLAGWVLWANLRSSEKPTSNGNAPVKTAVTARCGDGVCQSVTCQSVGCPQPETPVSCPADCPPASTAPDAGPSNANAPANVNAAGALNFSFATQSLAEAKVCPIEEANLTPAAAVELARTSGLTQGLRDVTVRLAFRTDKPDGCAWFIRNFETSQSGREAVVLDATQEVLAATPWRT